MGFLGSHALDCRKERNRKQRGDRPLDQRSTASGWRVKSLWLWRGAHSPSDPLRTLDGPDRSRFGLARIFNIATGRFVCGSQV